MDIKISVNSRTNPDLLGELLRNEFFCQDKNHYGCYSTFETRPEVNELPEESVGREFDDIDIKYHVFVKIIDEQNVFMKYYWDGDGTLEFHFGDGSFIVNDDCKKDYGWYYNKGQW